MIDYLGMSGSGFCELQNKSPFLPQQSFTSELFSLPLKGCDLLKSTSGLAHFSQSEAAPAHTNTHTTTLDMLNSPAYVHINMQISVT